MEEILDETQENRTLMEQIQKSTILEFGEGNVRLDLERYTMQDLQDAAFGLGAQMRLENTKRIKLVPKIEQLRSLRESEMRSSPLLPVGTGRLMPAVSLI